MKKLLFTALVAATAIGAFNHFPALASTQTSVTVGVGRVDYADLNISTDVGADRLLRRMRHAANLACDVKFRPRSESVMARERHCVRVAFEQAVAEIASPAVGSRHARDSAGFVFASVG